MSNNTLSTKFLMLYTPIFLFTTIVGIGTLTAQNADATGFKKNHVELNATGRTLGGPGVAKINGNDAADVIKFASDTPRSLCATAHNHGGGSASLQIWNGQSATTKSVKKGQTRSVCGEGTKVTIVCENSKCRVLWRVDDGS